MRIAALGLVLAVLATAREAHAYRPFDGTDGDVADPGEFELELGPAQYYAQGGQRFLVTPATVLNLGLVPRLELVSDIRPTIALDREPAEPRVRVLQTDVFLKWVAIPGVLQDRSGPSLAFEGGVLLPQYQDDAAYGAHLDAILSYRFGPLTAHLNEQLEYTRIRNADYFTSLILEGTPAYGVRPVGELLFETGDATIVSGLVGAIWALSERFSLDTALRVGSVDGQRMSEVRLGFTWGTPIWGGASHVENVSRL